MSELRPDAGACIPSHPSRRIIVNGCANCPYRWMPREAGLISYCDEGRGSGDSFVVPENDSTWFHPDCPLEQTGD